MMNQIMVIIYGPEILNINRFITGILIILIPHRKPAFLAHITLHIDVAGRCLCTVDVIVPFSILVKGFVSCRSYGIVFVVHYFD